MASNLRDIVLLCENVLGYELPKRGNLPLYRVRAMEVGRLKKALNGQPQISIRDLELAVRYSWNKRLRVTSPLDLIPRVVDARRLASPARRGDAKEQRRRHAIATEMLNRAEGYFEWVRRLQMTTGRALDESLQEWDATRRQTLTPAAEK